MTRRGVVMSPSTEPVARKSTMLVAVTLPVTAPLIVMVCSDQIGFDLCAWIRS